MHVALNLLVAIWYTLQSKQIENEIAASQN